MYERNNSHKLAKSTNETGDWRKYRYLRNLVTTEIRKSEKEYFALEIKKHRGKSSMWKPLKMALNTGNIHKSIPKSITANAFNEYFANIGKKLADKFKSQGDLSNMVQTDSSFILDDISIINIECRLKKLDKRSKLDLLQFDSKLLQIASTCIASDITHMFNLLFQQSILPTDWKKARIVPIYKGKGSENDCSNYRPISTLPFIAKLIESCMQEQLIKYLEQNNLLCCQQSAYLKKHSTTTSLHKVVDDWLRNINNGQINGVAFFDLSKCFDTIDHKRLLNKMKKYGINDNVLKWFQNYLIGREQAVTANEVLSEFLSMLIGVPQGFNLGPLLFLLFVNDFPQCLTCTVCNLFADDTAIYCSANSVSDASNILQKDVNNVIKWFHDNMLTVNIDKSCTLAIGTTRRLAAQNNDLNITIDNTSLQHVSNMKYLGVTIDRTLSWDDHISCISSVCKKVSPKIELLRKIKYKLPKDQLCTIYNSIIQPNFDYCISVWGNTSSKNIKLLQKLQNRAARIITGNYDWNQSATELVNNLGWQTMEKRKHYFTSLLMYKISNKLAPDYLLESFKTLSSVYSTRKADGVNLSIPKPNLEIFKQSLSYNGAQIWNQLPTELQKSTSVQNFKTIFKEYF